MRFAVPQMLWLLILVPITAAYLIWTINKRRQLLDRFAAPKALARFGLSVATTITWVRTGLFLFGTTALIIALARPQWGYHERRIISRGVDMMIAIDTSDSMMARDFQPDRLTRAKDLLKNLIWEAQGARVGVVAFSGASVIMCPLTLDYNMASTALKAVDINTVSSEGTNIASAITAASGGFEISGGNDRILILLTDGEQTEELEKLDAAVNKAAETGVRIFAIGIGTKEGATIPTMRGPKRDTAGNVVTTKMDFSKLEEITKKTKGVAVRAEKIGAGEIAQISAQLSQFKGQKQLDKSVRIYHDRYSWFLGAALVCFLLEALLHHFRRMSWRRRSRVTSAIVFAAVCFSISKDAAAYPGEAFIRAREAYSKFNAGEYSQALALYQRALELNPQDPQLQYNLAASAAKAKKVAEARKAFRSVYDPNNPRLNADALFGAATLDHMDVREVIKSKKESWVTDLAALSEKSDAAKKEIQEAISKLNTVLSEYQKSLLAKPDDVDMKANFELARKDLQELQKMLEDYEKNKQQQQPPQSQNNQDKNKDQQDKQDQQKPDDKNKDQQGQQGQQDQKENPDQDKPKDQPKDGKQGEQNPDKKPQDQGQEDKNKPGNESEDKQNEGKEGDKQNPEQKPDPKGKPTPTPTPSPTPSATPQPSPGSGQQGAPDAQGTPVPVGQMSPTDVDRLLNTLPPEDQQALQLMFGAGDNRQEDMKNDW